MHRMYVCVAYCAFYVYCLMCILCTSRVRVCVCPATTRVQIREQLNRFLYIFALNCPPTLKAVIMQHTPKNRSGHRFKTEITRAHTLKIDAKNNN